jgi:uncharacterized protein
MKEMITCIAQQLVDRPQDVKVTTVEGSYTTVFELRVAKQDIGKVIGRQVARPRRYAPFFLQ